jgi:hypothetical protein
MHMEFEKKNMMSNFFDMNKALIEGEKEYFLESNEFFFAFLYLRKNGI